MDAAEAGKNRISVLVLVLLLVAGLWLRVAFFQRAKIIRPLSGDARQYVWYAANLLRHGVFSSGNPTGHPAPDAFRSPGYPAFLAAAIFYGGNKGYYRLAVYTQVLSGGLVILLVYGLGRRFLPRPWALFATGLTALSPHLVSVGSFLVTESGYCLLLLAALYAFSLAASNHRPAAFILSAALFAAAYAFNETALLLPPLLTGVVLMKAPAGGQRAVALRLAVFLAVFLLAPAVWTARNAINVPPGAPNGSDRLITTLSHGAYPGFIHKNPDHRFYPYWDDPERETFGGSFSGFREVFIKRFQERPLRYLSWYLIEKPVWLWSWDILQSQIGFNKRPGDGDVYIYQVTDSLYLSSRPADLLRLCMKYAHPLVVLLALCGAILAVPRSRNQPAPTRRPVEPLLLAAILVYYTLIYTILAPWPRYTIPLRPELYLLAVWAAYRLRTIFGKAG